MILDSKGVDNLLNIVHDTFLIKYKDKSMELLNSDISKIFSNHKYDFFTRNDSNFYNFKFNILVEKDKDATDISKFIKTSLSKVFNNKNIEVSCNKVNEIKQYLELLVFVTIDVSDKHKFLELVNKV